MADASKAARMVKKAVKSTVTQAAEAAREKVAELSPPPIPGVPAPAAAEPGGADEAEGSAAAQAGPGRPGPAYGDRGRRPPCPRRTSPSRAAS